MAKGRQQKRFVISSAVSGAPMSIADLRAAEDILAKLIAQCCATDHPELLGPVSGQPNDDPDNDMPSVDIKSTNVEVAMDDPGEPAES